MRAGRVFVSLVLVALGVLFLLDRSGAIDAGGVLADWWPVTIIALGLLGLYDRPRSLLGPAVVVAVGVILLLTTLDVVEGSVWGIVWPVVLILVGLTILFRHLGRPRSRVAGEDAVNESVVFGGSEIVSRSGSFRGGAVRATFGGLTLDLRQAALPPDGSTVEAVATFGGIDIVVPTTWRVSLRCSPFLGGCADETKQEAPLPPEAPHLRVAARATFGGVRVTNEP